jgi:phage baseplate assembly protein W
MPTYVGFSTIDANQPREFLRTGADGGVGSITQKPRTGRKYRLVDAQLVARDLQNAFGIKQGEKVGNPTYGTTLWNYVFEPNTSETRIQIENEVRRVASLDPRFAIETLEIYEHTNGVLVELQILVSPFNNIVQVGLLFDRQTNGVSAIAL